MALYGMADCLVKGAPEEARPYVASVTNSVRQRGRCQSGYRRGALEAISGTQVEFPNQRCRQGESQNRGHASHGVKG